MNSVNHVMVLGNLTRDPELRYTPSGTAVCQLGVALNRRWRDQAGELQQEVTFVDVTVWSKQAETVAQYLTKGRAVAIEGRLQQDTWETESGERRSRLKVVAQRVTFLSSANGSPVPAAADGEAAPDWVNEQVER
jgi:single-strand DNA-binding protein